MEDNDTLLMVLLWVLGGVCVWQANGGSLGTEAGIVTRLTGLKRGLCLPGFKLAQIAQAGREREERRGH